jgi:sec-independent protein translocase protein TatC
MPNGRPAKPGVMPLGEHLEELRTRVIWAVVGIVPILIIALVFSKTILGVLMQPLLDAMGVHNVADKPQVTGLLEGFLNWVKAAMIVTVVFGAPWILFQLWLFVSPGLYDREKRFAHILAPLSILMSVLGVAFMYFVILKFALGFFVHFNQTLATRPDVATAPLPAGVELGRIPVLNADPQTPEPGNMWINAELRQLRIAIQPAPSHYALPGMGFLKIAKSEEQTAEPASGSPSKPVVLNLPLGDDSLIGQHYKLSEYMSTILKFALAAAVAFQVPVVVLLLGWVGILSREMMSRYRRHVCGAITILAAIFTPPDPFSMLIMIGAMYGLFELGLLLLWLMPADRVSRGTVLSRRRQLPPPVDRASDDAGGRT